ncbi:putative inhibitor of apoptosis [Mercenaria mercenaria]|uniref:putative inhibitor of apoptosis n=1 Tax=Mercenaria mercenaria TaxID=6596 RepID=UPI00234EDA16|nr:putative inhibitor of apoptosis [Mercenaria mercenaria]XP_053395459.1 putative inhibitor of apoptosis [Mercenaria mercenaria]XP_053395460.1 putative inhibitor of apoptosis [Mercenaria mercenaria]
MAGVLSRSQISEDIQDYFRKDRRRNPGNNHTSVNTSHNKSPRNRDNPSKCDTLGILIDRPKHKQYGTLQSRIASFENWPQDKTQEVRQLAEAGFGYTGVDDSVRCFYCSIGLKDWLEGACPWEHVLASPDCGHVMQCKGKGYIRKILGEKDQDSDVDVDDSDEVVDTVQLAINRNEGAVIAAREYCTDEDILKRAIKTLIKQDAQKQFSAVDLIKVIQEFEETNENANATSQLSEDEEQDDIETDEDISEEEEDMKETNRKLKEPVTCKICYDAIACIITLPCGHMVCCSQCISALTKCAVCRTQIKGTVRALMAV